MANAPDPDVLEIEPEALRAAEFMQAQAVLEGMLGRTVVRASVEETRIAIETDDGAIYYFYGFMGENAAPDAP